MPDKHEVSDVRNVLLELFSKYEDKYGYKLKASVVASATGLNPGQLHKLLSSDSSKNTKNPRIETLRKITDFFVSKGIIISVDRLFFNDVGDHVEKKYRNTPVFQIKNNQLMFDNKSATIDCHDKFIKIRIPEGMIPLFQIEVTITINTQDKLNDEDLVLIKTASHSSTYKIYRYKQNKFYSVNTDQEASLNSIKVVLGKISEIEV